MLHTRRWWLRFLFAALMAALIAPVCPAGASGLQEISWEDKTILVFMATDDSIAVSARMVTEERMVMLILIGKDFEMTASAAEAIKADIRLQGASGDYEAEAVFVAEADDGNNPDVEVYFSVPEELLSALTLRFESGEAEIRLSEVPKSINQAITALIEELSPQDMTIESLDTDETLTLDMSSAQPVRPLIEMIKSEHIDVYRDALAFLNEGNVFKSGTRDVSTMGLQLLLTELGEDVKVDGKIGAKTMSAAENVARGSLIGPDESLKEIDKQTFEGMMISLLFMQDQNAAIAYLNATAEEPEKEISYYTASKAFREGAYYTAYREYAGLPGYRHSDAYGVMCAQPLPENGEMARSEAFGSKECRLFVQATLEEGVASCVKVRTVSGEAVTMMFIKESGEVGVRLPEGEYMVSVGVGETWYGEKEAFGGSPGAYYLTLHSEEENPIFALEPGYSYTLTLKSDMEEGDLSSENLDYGVFSG